jgi:hypothetical protein
MAITPANAVYTGLPNSQPLAGQIITSGGTNQVAGVYAATATFTLDGSTTAVVVNLIDGTQTLPFTPSGVLLNVSGGTQQAASPISAIVRSITNTVINLTLSAAGTAGNTVVVTFECRK